MSLNRRQDQQLKTIISLIEELRRDASKTANGSGIRRRRRSAEDARKMREDILAARARGVPARKLAAKYDVSTAYVYMIKG